MVRRCFVHVGSPKTGTTYLQGVLWGSRAALAEQGITLPLRRRDHFFVSLHLRGALDPEVDPPGVADVLTRLDAAVARAPGDVLISNELLAVAKPEAIAEFLDRLTDFEVHVVVTARDWQRQLPAEWQQFVKTRHQHSFEHFLDRVRDNPDHRFRTGQDYARVASRWAAALPQGRVHVVTVPPAGAPGTLLLERFCSVIGADPAPLETTPSRTNTSIGYEQIELIRRVNNALGDRLAKPRAGYSRVAKFWFAEEVLAAQAGTRLALPTDRLDWCHRESEIMVGALRDAGYDVVGDLADLLPGASGDPSADTVPADDRVLESAVEAVAAMLTQRDVDLKRIGSLERDLLAARAEAEQAAGSAAAAHEPTPTRLQRWTGRGGRR